MHVDGIQYDIMLVSLTVLVLRVISEVVFARIDSFVSVRFCKLVTKMYVAVWCLFLSTHFWSYLAIQCTIWWWCSCWALLCIFSVFCC